MIKEDILLSEVPKKLLSDKKEWPLTSFIHSKQKNNQPLGSLKSVLFQKVLQLYPPYSNLLLKMTKVVLVSIAE